MLSFRSLARLRLGLMALLLVHCSSDPRSAEHHPGTGGHGGADNRAGAAGLSTSGASTGGSSGDGASGDSGSDGAPPLRLRFAHGFVKRAAARPEGGLLVLIEAPLLLRTQHGKPKRELRWVDEHGAVQASVASTSTRSLLDFALHPSGEATLLFAADAGYTLSRFDAHARLLFETAIQDDRIASDPPALREGESSGPIEPNTHDSGRVAAAGEATVTATRTARHSVIAYRHESTGSRYATTRRTLVVPPMHIYPVGLTGGTYDTFGQLELQFSLQLAVGTDGMTYVGVQPPRVAPSDLARVHAAVFGETLTGDPDSLDFYVTRIDADGLRLGTSVVSTPEEDELYGLHASEGIVLAVGRKEHWNEHGTGFDALVARIDARSGAAQLIEFDVDRSDVAFDAVLAGAGALLVVGASGYTQNPHGLSVSEESRAFARIVPVAGGPAELAELPASGRHDEARVLVEAADGHWLVGGMIDGPGTHSADADASLLRARGFLDELSPEKARP